MYILELSGADGRTAVRAISNKLVTLGRIYASSDRYFPLGKHHLATPLLSVLPRSKVLKCILQLVAAFIVRYLEQRSCELSLDAIELTFVVTSLTQVGVPLPRLLEIYDRLHAAKV